MEKIVFFLKKMDNITYFDSYYQKISTIINKKRYFKQHLNSLSVISFLQH